MYYMNGVCISLRGLYHHRVRLIKRPSGDIMFVYRLLEYLVWLASDAELIIDTLVGVWPNNMRQDQGI